MLYTIVPMETIFQTELPETEEEKRGTTHLVWRKEGTNRTLCRVISTDLRDYLNYKV